MMISKLALAGLTLLGLAEFAGTANAAPFENQALCVDQISRLDTNRDGFIDAQEWPTIADIHKNVDLNGDGRISHDEMIGACDDGIVEIF
ncbi:MAG: hypothetical protein ACFCUR_04935 [Rhodomicrobiaceae bacterium]